MKILYGVQGTGNGHISRSNSMAEALASHPELELTWLLSGREQQLGCGNIQNFLWREGLTFVARNGKINILETFKKLNLYKFWQDINTLDLTPYDLIISDYEPVIAHAARKRGVRVVGIGHQYAFNHSIPMPGANPIEKALMKNFAPATTAIGLHWHHFGFPILPPILDRDLLVAKPIVTPNKYLVYMPFENLEFLTALLQPLVGFEFYIYHPQAQVKDLSNLHYRPISRSGFKQDLLNTCGVITNSGFELIGECLHLGKRVLTKPLMGQMEQISNAAALAQLGYAEVLNKLERPSIESWLNRQTVVTQICYPDVAQVLASWIAGGCTQTTETLASRLWQ